MHERTPLRACSALARCSGALRSAVCIRGFRFGEPARAAGAWRGRCRRQRRRQWWRGNGGAGTRVGNGCAGAEGGRRGAGARDARGRRDRRGIQSAWRAQPSENISCGHVRERVVKSLLLCAFGSPRQSRGQSAPRRHAWRRSRKSPRSPIACARRRGGRTRRSQSSRVRGHAPRGRAMGSRVRTRAQCWRQPVASAPSSPSRAQCPRWDATRCCCACVIEHMCVCVPRQLEARVEELSDQVESVTVDQQLAVAGARVF